MVWSPQQDAALGAVSEWMKTGIPQVFRLFGFAGTGKTTLARHIADGLDGEVCFGAFTGKAAHVLRSKGCRNAATIHSLIYRPRASDDDDETPVFALNRESDVSGASLVIIDECSMVDEELGKDLLSFGVPVLVLGDPAQLPPVSGGGFFTEADPDVMLTEVHRQAADNPIIRLSLDIREGRDIVHGIYGESRVIRRKEIDSEAILATDQVLVGMNRTRHLYNQRMRALKGYDQAMPACGEKLVCLRNDKAKGLLNGSIWEVKRLRAPKGNKIKLDVTSEEDPRKSVTVSVLPAFFDGTAGELPYAVRRNSEEFDFGYALTVHKAQGSQWDDVVLFDESGAFREHKARWLYTGVTRAAERITIVK